MQRLRSTICLHLKSPIRKRGVKRAPHDQITHWFFIVPEGGNVQIDFDILELEDREDCKNDYIQFRKAPSWLVTLKQYMAIWVQSWQDACLEIQSQTWYWVKGTLFGFSSRVTETLPQCTRDSKLLLKQVCYNNKVC